MALSARFGAGRNSTGLAGPQEEEAGRLAARRVLRAGRARTGAPIPWARAIGMSAVLILAVASLGTLWVVNRHADDEAASRATTIAVPEAFVPGVATDNIHALATGIPISSDVADAVSAPALLGASSGSPPIEIPASGVFSIVTSGERLELALLTADEARTLSGGGWSQGLRVTGAVAGNRLGVTSGDVIHDLCDQLGDQSPSEIVAALTANTTSCVTFVRRGGGARPSMNGPSLDE